MVAALFSASCSVVETVAYRQGTLIADHSHNAVLYVSANQLIREQLEGVRNIQDSVDDLCSYNVLHQIVPLSSGHTLLLGGRRQELSVGGRNITGTWMAGCAINWSRREILTLEQLLPGSSLLPESNDGIVHFYEGAVTHFRYLWFDRRRDVEVIDAVRGNSGHIRITKTIDLDRCDLAELPGETISFCIGAAPGGRLTLSAERFANTVWPIVQQSIHRRQLTIGRNLTSFVTDTHGPYVAVSGQEAGGPRSVVLVLDIREAAPPVVLQWETTETIRAIEVNSQRQEILIGASRVPPAGSAIDHETTNGQIYRLRFTGETTRVYTVGFVPVSIAWPVSADSFYVGGVTQLQRISL